MKVSSLSKLIVLTSITLFTACSTTSPEPTKTTPTKLTTLEILGIDSHPRVVINETTTLPIKNIVSNEIENLPMAETYPIELTPITYPSEPIITNNYIENYLTIANDIELTAKSLLGIKYVWGATGPSTYDCSGFTQKVYRDAGINIPRVSREQAQVGQYVSFNSLRRGDMVFFDTHKRRSGKVTHVGIYLGNNNFIHASSAAKKVVIFNFDEKPFYKKRFLWGRRVIRDNYFMASL